MRLVLAILGLSLAGACGARVVSVGPLSPEPSLRIAYAGNPTGLVVEGLDAVRVRSRGSFPVIDVRGVRETVRRSFEHGLGAEHIASSGAERTLKVEILSLTFVTDRDVSLGETSPQAVLVHGGYQHRPSKPPVQTRYARIEFSAKVIDRGRPIGELSASVTATVAARGDRASITRSITSAVSALCAHVGQRLFVDQMASRKADPGRVGRW